MSSLEEYKTRESLNIILYCHLFLLISRFLPNVLYFFCFRIISLRVFWVDARLLSVFGNREYWKVKENGLDCL